MLWHVLLWPFLILYQLATAHAQIHFYTTAGTKTCFYRELTANILLVGKFKMDIRDPDSGEYVRPRDKENTGILIDVEETFDDNHKVVHQRASFSGQFTFSALDTGEHRICFVPKSFFKRGWRKAKPSPPTGSAGSDAVATDPKFTEVRFSVHFEVRDGSFIDSRSSHKVEGLVRNVNALNDKLIDIRREQVFIREKECTFRDQSEKACAAVLRWSILQAGAILLMFLYQAIVLRKCYNTQKEKKE